jgi:hypothetical protein
VLILLCSSPFPQPPTASGVLSPLSTFNTLSCSCCTCRRSPGVSRILQQNPLTRHHIQNFQPPSRCTDVDFSLCSHAFLAEIPVVVARSYAAQMVDSGRKVFWGGEFCLWMCQSSISIRYSRPIVAKKGSEWQKRQRLTGSTSTAQTQCRLMST